MLLVGCSHKIDLNNQKMVLNHLNNLVIEAKIDLPLMKIQDGIYKSIFDYEPFVMVMVPEKDGINKIESILKQKIDYDKCYVLQKASKYPLLVYLEGRNVDKLGEILKDEGLFVYNIDKQ